MVSKEKVREIAEEVKDNWPWDDFVGDCSKLSNRLWERLNEEGTDCDVIEGKIKDDYGQSTRHVFVTVELDSGERCIVDLTLSQFQPEKAEEYNFESRIDADLPEIYIGTEGDKFYDRYRFA